MGQLTQTTAQVQVILDDADAANVGKTSLTDSTDTTAVAVKKSGFYSLGASSSNAPSTDRAILISAVRDTAATGEIRYGQVAITESNGMWWNRDDGGALGTWYEAVSTAGTQTLTNKTLTSPVLTTPQINDTSADHQYIFAVSELVADRTVTLPLLTGNDTFVFAAHTQTLTNKTLTSPVFDTGVSGSAVLDDDTFATASATTLATSESIKAYVDTQLTAEDLDFAGDTGTGAVDLDSQTFTIAGTANEIETSATSQTLTIGLPDSVTITTALSVDTISEKTSAAGVTIDSLLIKDISIGTADASGTDAAGTAVTVKGGAGTGTGAGGSLVFQTAPAGTTGSTPNAQVTAMSIDSTGAVDMNVSLNVDGTVTADGLTVDGSVTLNSTAVALAMNETDTTDLNSFLRSTAGQFRIDTLNDAGSVATKRLAVDHATGDISFYEDTGTTAKLFWDASAESLGIGTTAPTYAKTVIQQDAVGASSILALDNFTSGTGNEAVLSMGRSNTANRRVKIRAVGVGNNFTSPALAFDVNESEAMRIDSSGNVSISKTDSVTYSSSAIQGDLIVSRLNSANTVNQVVGLEFDVTGWSGSTTGVAGISAVQTGSNASTADLVFQTRNAGTIGERMRIDSSGTLLVNDTSARAYGAYGGSTSAGMQLAGTTVSSSAFSINRYGAVANGAQIVLAHSRGAAVGTNTIVANDDPLGIINFDGANGTDYDIAAQIRGEVDGTPGATTDMPGRLTFWTTANASATPEERMRIDSSGNLLVGTTDTTPWDNSTATSADDGIFLGGGRLGLAKWGGVPLLVNRTDSEGEIAIFYKDGSPVGSIGTLSSDLYIGTGDTGLTFNDGSDIIIPTDASTGIYRDAAIDLGYSSGRFKDLYRSGSTISTSDRNMKQDERALTEAETRVAQACKGLLKAFRFIDAVEVDGDNARIHFGIIAQDLQAAFEAEGLDATKYAMFRPSTYTDDEGNEQTRLGVCYENLLAFIIAAI